MPDDASNVAREIAQSLREQIEIAKAANLLDLAETLSHALAEALLQSDITRKPN